VIKKHKPLPIKKRSKNILIVGGQLSNLGIQALLFCIVDQLSRSFPDSDIYLLSLRDHLRSEEEKQAYKFTILPWDLEIKAWLLNKKARILRHLRGRKQDPKVIATLRSLLEDAAFFVDISGFSLSSQWPFRVSLHYLSNIMLARRFGAPFYILPQSFGPFDFSQVQKMLIFPYMRRLLAYPERIFAREASSLEAVTRFTKHNVYPRPHLDMVLLNKGFDLNRIYRTTKSRRPMRIEAPAVGVIPNLRVMERTDADRMYSIYQDMIDVLLQHGKSVYIFSHTGDIDSSTARKIHQASGGKSGVFLIERGFDVVEMEALMRCFEFIISSRYHAVVHAYKNGAPALVIGWASKYHELLEKFDQSQYLTDVRDGLDKGNILAKLDNLLENSGREKQVIQTKMQALAGMDNAAVFSAIKDR
jgi:colanic acid/amylovoran biosynthesis protein